MGRTLALTATLALAVGCASTRTPGEEATAPAAAQAAEAPAADAVPQPAPAEPAKSPPRSRTFRLGFWEIDLLALDLEPRGTTFRVLDIRIFKLFEMGFGEDYHSVSFVEAPHLFNAITTRRDGITREHRVADVQVFALAALRVLRESARKSETHVLKAPIVGSLYATETDGPSQERTLLYLVRYEADQ